MTSEEVYVLSLNKKGNYYVGKSKNKQLRINDHKNLNENSAEFVKECNGVYKAVKPLTPKDENGSNWEKDELLVRMIKHGFNNVRGWEFTNTKPLTNSECNIIKTLIMGLGDRCRKCGNEGHFANNCIQIKADWLINLEKCMVISHGSETMKKITSKDIINSQINISVNKSSTNRKKKECKRCGRTNHTTNSCFAEFDINGEYIDSDFSSDDDHYNMRCFRCDRIGHFANECYARYDNKGYFIMD